MNSCLLLILPLRASLAFSAILPTLTFYQGGVTSVAFSPKGDFLSSGGQVSLPLLLLLLLLHLLLVQQLILLLIYFPF